MPRFLKIRAASHLALALLLTLGSFSACLQRPRTKPAATPPLQADVEPAKAKAAAEEKPKPPLSARDAALLASELTKLTGAERRRLDVILLIIEEADKAKAESERKKLLDEFLEKSAAFLVEHAKQTNLWVMQAEVALELNRSRPGREAGRELLALGLGESDDARIRKVLAMLDRKGWLAEDPIQRPKAGQPWTNSLGMKFVAVPGTPVLFSVWHTRVQDFEAFVKATGHQANAGMFSLGADGWRQRGHTWKNPGFEQGPTSPVCGVGWGDARAFCQWLTEQERRDGLLEGKHTYRLPTDAEWSVAVGLGAESGNTPAEKNEAVGDVYPWGGPWPPPEGAGNYGGEESRSGAEPSNWVVIQEYNDGFARTSPVGSFKANRHGLYDMGGNLWHWCEDWFDGNQQVRVLRGGSWYFSAASDMLSSCRGRYTPAGRRDTVGFRCVLELEPRP